MLCMFMTGSCVPGSCTSVLTSCVSRTVQDQNATVLWHWETPGCVRWDIRNGPALLILRCQPNVQCWSVQTEKEKVSVSLVMHIHNYVHYLLCPGTVTRATTVKVLECSRQFQCSRCHLVFSVSADLEQHNSIPRPQWWVCGGVGVWGCIVWVWVTMCCESVWT